MRDPRLRWRYFSGETDPESLVQAQTLAERVGLGNPSCEALDDAEAKLTKPNMACWERFNSTLIEILSQTEDRRSAWAAALFEDFKARVANPDALVWLSVNLPQWRAAMDSWQEALLPLAAWGDFRGGIWFDDAFDRHLDLLAQLDIDRFAEALDSLPAPEAMTFALGREPVGEDPELIVELLSRAPKIFDIDGRWLSSRSAVALLITHQAIDYARKLRRAVFVARSRGPRPISDMPSLPSDEELAKEIGGWFARVFGVLVARDDGPVLGAVVLAKLTAARMQWTGHIVAAMILDHEAAITALADELAAAGCTIDILEQAYRRNLEHIRRQHPAPTVICSDERVSGGEGWRTLGGDGLSHLLAAAELLEAQQRREANAESPAGFWSWARELLRGRDEGLRSMAGEFAAPPQLGRLLAQVDAPDELLRAMYTELEPQRRRARFSSHDGLDDDAESIVVLRMGLHAAANWHKVGRHEPASDLFWWIYTAARRLWLTATEDQERGKAEIVASCFAVMPHLFGDVLDEALQRALPPIAGDAELVGQAAAKLVDNNVTPTHVRAAFQKAGVDLEGALRDAKQWADLIDPKGRLSLFPPNLAKLAEQLGVHFDLQETAAAIDLQAQIAEFAAKIPWAQTLLDRIANDGGELTVLSPLESDLAWLVQIALPEEMRQRFGLAPELRVLAVHGQVSGRVLRLAVSFLERAELVDPDLLCIATRQPGLTRRLPRLAGPWGQRVPWVPSEAGFVPLAEALAANLPSFDLFDYRDPVHGNALVGREHEIADICERLVRGETIGVVGLRKVGKSSLLRAVAEQLDPIGARLGMFESLRVPLPSLEKAETLVISMDVQGLAQRTLDAFASRLSMEIDERVDLANTNSTPLEAAPEAGQGIRRFEVSLDRALEHGPATLCFMFDEYDLLFEGYSGEPGIPGVERLFAVLRSKAHSTRRVSLAFAGRDPSFLERPHIGGVTSPLAGRTKAIFLGPLTRAEADELLIRLGKRTGLAIGPRTLELAWSMTGGHPLLTRQFGSLLLARARKSEHQPPVDSDRLCDRARQEFLVSEVVYTLRSEVEALLSARYPQALELLVALSRGQAVSVSDPRQYQLLRGFGLLSANEPPVVPEVFREWFAGFGVVLDKGA